LIAKCDAVIWLAAIVGAPACEQDERQAWAVNRDSIVNALWSLGDKLFIYPNSNSGYGIGGESECTEDDELRPISVYGKSKVQAEYAIREQLRRSIVFRFATLFGLSPRFRRDLLVNDFTLRALDEGSIVLYEPHFRRNYLHVQDAANAIIWAIEGRLKDNQVYNCGIDDANLTKLQLCEKIKEYVPNLDIVISDKRSDPDKRDYQISNQKLYARSWCPQMTLDDGIKEIIKAWPMLRHRNRYANI
jgi:nucleoside-diphosphate-sugar epimerase